jgi:hypothetical protein
MAAPKRVQAEDEAQAYPDLAPRHQDIDDAQ